VQQLLGLFPSSYQFTTAYILGYLNEKMLHRRGPSLSAVGLLLLVMMTSDSEDDSYRRDAAVKKNFGSSK